MAGAIGEPAYQPSPSENVKTIGRSIVNRCLVPALRNASVPADFKAPRKLANYTADMDPAVWMESYELAMDLLRASDGICARYFMMMLEGPDRIWFKNLPEYSVTSWTDLKEKFIKNFQGTCKRATTIVNLEHCVQKEGESTLSWAR